GCLRLGLLGAPGLRGRRVVLGDGDRDGLAVAADDRAGVDRLAALGGVAHALLPGGALGAGGARAHAGGLLAGGLLGGLLRHVESPSCLENSEARDERASGEGSDLD